MFNININKLNKLELQIHETLLAEIKNKPNFRIVDASTVCQCSNSKISKFVKKLGFDNYKQYVDFIVTGEIPSKKQSSEFDRIKNYLDGFNYKLVDDFIDYINKYDKIIFFGYGPSLYCAQYLEYKLRVLLKKSVVSVVDKLTAESMIDENTLLVVFSTSGNFRSFDSFEHLTQEKNAGYLIVVEEYNKSIAPQYGSIFFLSDSHQKYTNIPYYKSRVLTFIFIDEVIQKILKDKESLLNSQ